ncbi:unnamed protein product [Phytophthora fragariaefolia]|uniref:Unnamed protein product n=1 Tax=Phytophthora fragariaefolia TaxID=1490495 RepID=A0A9W6YAS0_9STRA|nr:unnamed protein product [Phytophthora fragariaefolia]
MALSFSPPTTQAVSKRSSGLYSPSIPESRYRCRGNDRGAEGTLGRRDRADRAPAEDDPGRQDGYRDQRGARLATPQIPAVARRRIGCKLKETVQDVEDDVKPPVSHFTTQGMQRYAASAAPQQAAASTVPQADQLQPAPVSGQPLASHQAPAGPQAMPATPAKPPNPMLPDDPEQKPLDPKQPAAPAASQRSPKVKDIHCRRFDGKEVYPGLGAGVEDFLNEFECAVQMERLLNQSTWSSELKASVLGTFLESQASRSYHDFTGSRDVSYEELITRLKREFGCNLSQYELGKRLDTHKRAGDTWKQYVTYLKFIERLMVGDRSQLLLETFCNNACPELKSTLLSMIDDSCDNHMKELDKVVDFPIRSQGHGRRVGQVQAGGRGGGAGGSQQQQQQQRSNRQQRQGHQRDNGNANSAEKPITCWNCGQTGHRQAQCLHPKKSTGEASARQAQQQSGLAESDSDEEDASELWMASGTTNGLDGVSSTWLVDSGASHHMCSDATILSGTSPSKQVVKVANGGLLHASVKRSCILRVQNDSVVRSVLLHEVHHVPGLDRNLLSVTGLSEHGVITVFGKAECSLKNPQGDVIAAVERQGKLWILTGETMDTGTDGAAMFVQAPKATLQLWHDRLVHLNFQDLLRMYSKCLTEDMEAVSKKLRFCLSCAEAKQTKSKQPTADTSDSAPTDEVGAVLGVDLKTDIRSADRNGNKHMLTIVDHGSSYRRVYLLQTKDEASERLMEFLPEFERQHGVQVKVVRSDGGGEFFGHEFAAYCKCHGMKQQSSLSDSSASNGKVERMHRTLVNSGRAMLWASGLPERYWGDAVKYASYIRNRVTTRANADHRAPLHVLTGKEPKIAHILRFGSTCAVHVAHKKAASVKRRAEKAVVIGISEMQKGYRWFLPRTNRIVTSADVQNIDRLDVHEKETTEVLNELHDVHSEFQLTQELVDEVADPWEVAKAPAGTNVVSSKWVFKIKFNSRGELERFKARLVARGFLQRYGVDFAETYSPVLTTTSLRFLAALMAQWKPRLRQEDVPNAYVKASLDRPIWIRPSKGTTCPPDSAWLLKKGLYGLKQSGLLWNNEINAFLLSVGFVRSKLDPCLYTRRRNRALTVLSLYVDDVIVVAESDADSDWVMQQLGKRFDIKDLGDATKVLGISIEYTEDGFILHQRDSIEELLIDMDMATFRPVSTPMESGVFDDDAAMEQTSVMRRAIGSLLWISNCTRPGITAAVNYLARFVARPCEGHWRGVKRILRYLCGTASTGLFFKHGPGISCKWNATIFSDADWTGDTSDAKSVSGAVLVLNGTVIALALKKQTSVALSTMAAEYVAAVVAVKDAAWVKQLLVEIGPWTSARSVNLQVDNRSAIKSMENQMTSARSKHINVGYHYIRDVIARDDVIVSDCPTQQPLANILTKPLQRVVFELLREQLRVVRLA